MENAFDEYALEAIGQEHPIAVAMFVPFAIARLHRDPEDTEARVRVRMRNIGGQPEEECMLRLFWSVESVAKQPLAVQDHIITEWAALAMACVVLAKYTPLRLRAVALQGDRFDYWVTDGRRDYGLEIRGTREEDSEGRHRDKVRQLLANPYRIDGYALAVRFPVPEVLFFLPSFRGASQMSDPSTTGFDRQGLDEAYAAAEFRKSNLILEGRLLEARQQWDEAAQKFAQAAEQEERLGDHCAKLGLSERASLHFFSAASCWARAGNIYRAIALCDDLLRRTDMSEPLRQRIQDYAHALRNRRAQWVTGLPLLAAPAGV